MKMGDLTPGQVGRVEYIDEGGGRLEDLGLIRGSEVRCLFRAPMGDPTAYLIKGAAVALRKRDAGKVHLSPWA